MKILIADDHPIVRYGFSELLKSFAIIQEVDEAENGAQVLEKLKTSFFDCVFLDLNMPVKTGFEVLEELQNYDGLKPKIIVFSLLNQKYPILKAYHMGIDGYISKNSSRAELEKLLSQLKAGDQYFSKDIYQVLLKEIQKEQNQLHEDQYEASLSLIEQKVVKALCRQKNNQEIAESLFLSPNTIKRHRQRIKEKIGAKNVVGFIHYALKHGIVTLNDLAEHD